MADDSLKCTVKSISKGPGCTTCVLGVQGLVDVDISGVHCVDLIWEPSFKIEDQVLARKKPNGPYNEGTILDIQVEDRTYNIKWGDGKSTKSALPRSFVRPADSFDVIRQNGELHWPYEGSGSAWAVNDVIGCALDIESQQLWYFRNGELVCQGQQSAGTELSAENAMFAGVYSIHGLQPCLTVGEDIEIACSFDQHFHFGQDGSQTASMPHLNGKVFEWVSEWTEERRQWAQNKQDEQTKDADKQVGDSVKQGDEKAQVQMELLAQPGADGTSLKDQCQELLDTRFNKMFPKNPEQHKKIRTQLCRMCF
eukprot:COSAG06_NODE_15795_length_1043_cov_1.721398_1_plen_309_part_10